MLRETQTNPETAAPDADKIERLLELELIQKRAEWRKAGARHQSIRTIAYAFVLFVVIAALAGFFIVYTRMNDRRAAGHDQSFVATP